MHTALDDRRFELKGPLGKGLRVKDTGVHIAFAAGTGVLCFVDLVAAITRQALSIDISNNAYGEEDKLDVNPLGNRKSKVTDSIRISTLDGNFKFYLYVSFPNRNDSVALELFEALSNYCNRKGMKNFDLFVRLSQEGKNPARWNEDFIQDQLRQFNVDEIQKIWVCGPPAMNETFDRAFHKVDEQF